MTKRFAPCDLSQQARILKKGLDRAFGRVLLSGTYASGQEVTRFESRFRNLQKTRWAVGTSSGTDAIRMALLACGIKTGDEVIVPAMTFIATAEAVLQTGAKPVLVDIEPQTYGMDPQLLEKYITKRTRVILPVHLYGHPADMPRIMRITRQYRLTLIEDACQAHLASIQGRTVGTFGRLAAYSFYPTKNLGAIGDGGIVVGRQMRDEKVVRRLINHGGLDRDEHRMLGFTARLDPLQAALLDVKLDHLKAWNLKYPARWAPELVWYVMGDDRALLYLLETHVTHIGKKSRHGNGRVLRWRVEQFEHDWSIRRGAQPPVIAITSRRVLSKCVASSYVTPFLV